MSRNSHRGVPPKPEFFKHHYTTLCLQIARLLAPWGGVQKMTRISLAASPLGFVQAQYRGETSGRNQRTQWRESPSGRALNLGHTSVSPGIFKK